MPQLYLSIGMFLWLALDVCFDGARMDYRQMLETERNHLIDDGYTDFFDFKLFAGAVLTINMLAFVCFWPFVVGYKLITLMSAPMER